MTRPTYEECAAAGMSQAEAARARGAGRSAASLYSKMHNLQFKNGRTDPDSRERRIAALKAAMTTPNVRAQLSARMKKMRQDPAFAARLGRRIPVGLTDAEVEDYRFLTKRKHLTRDEALRAVGRADLIEGAQ